MVPVVSFVGGTNCGKTTYLEKLIPELKRRGWKVAVLKHDAHGFVMDVPGKDTWRHTRAGADVVCISAPGRAAMLRQVEGELTLAEVCAWCQDVDIILTEGYKRENAPKIEVFRKERGDSTIFAAADLLAMVSDSAQHPDLPTFPLDSPAPMADFLEENLLRGKGKRP